MPGLNQLKQFNKDIQSLGDEVTIRASRGEKPVRVPIPRTVEDRDDSPDFELGMPEIAAPVDNSAVDDDLSEITGISTSSNNSEEQAPSFEAPDMSSLLNPIIDNSSESDMPDLSMFMDTSAEPESTEEEVFEEAPKEISIADMGLDALLSGAGFDGSEVTDYSEKSKQNNDFYDDFDDDQNAASLPSLEEEVEPEPVEEIIEEPVVSPSIDHGAPLDIDAILNSGKKAAQPVEEPEPVLENDFSFDNPVEEIQDIPTIDSGESDIDFGNKLNFGNSDFDIELPVEDTHFDLSKVAVKTQETAVPEKATVNNTFNYYDDDDDFGFAMDEIPSLEEDNVLTDDIAVSDSFDSADESSENSDVLDFDNFSSDPLDFGNESKDIFADNSNDFENSDVFGSDLSDDIFNLPDLDSSLDSANNNANQDGDFSDVFSLLDSDNTTSEDDAAETTDAFDMPDLATTDFEETSETTDAFDMPDLATTDFGETSETTDTFDMPDLGTTDFEETSDTTDTFDMPDLGTTDFEETSESSDIFDSSSVNFSDFTEEKISDDYDDFDDNSSSEEPIEKYDLSGMEGLDFDLPTTDSNINSSGLDDDFGMDGSDDFHIPGFSDVVDSANLNPKANKNTKLDEPDFNGALAGKELPPNTLSDEQYKKFLENFKEYPLNVRIAFENFIVQDEFTDDAEFEIIEKILNKAPARQVAANLEKMMDISIPVPRDYEHRTAAEYEAYKKSIGYQLKNKIIPMALVGMVLLLLGWGIFNFTKYIIVIPAQAESLYKQGYALLQSDEYPQSEIKFNQAAEKKLKKNWFFKYARGYRDKKQYQRASKMYENLLKCFKHDKEAGLEYADMALNDLVDYERAEEIVRRQILDYHAADPDARLLLGDIFLEWGTEKQPEKLELAKDQYMNLLAEVNNSKLENLYNSRMMRYYIRTDKLANVLTYKDMFEPKEKNLAPEDWTELSGYLLKKLYGPMAPSEEVLRSKIEGLRKLLLRAVTLDNENPVAYYNIGNYYIKTNEIMNVESALKDAISKFNEAPHLKNRDIYKYIDSYRLLGENYIKTEDILQAQESYSDGITLYTAEKEASDFKGNEDVGHLYADLADINYFSAGDYKNAEMNYQSGIELGYDNQKIRYRLGYIQYQNKNYQPALGSFIKAGEGSVKEKNLLLAMGNTLSLRNDDYAAEGYYSQLIDKLNTEILNRGGGIFPQADKTEYDIMTTYLYASNNYGVTLHRLAERTGDSSRNSDAIVQFQQSERAWDSLTRNQQTMVRLGGSNLAEENLKYITHPDSTFEPSIYVEIPKTLTENEGL